MKKLLPLISAILLAAFGLTSCETPGQTALLGAALGGASGNHPIRNAAIGAAAGYVVGKLAQHERRREDANLPVARPTRRYWLVVSPYTGELVDVRGIPSGARVEDPSSGRDFINP